MCGSQVIGARQQIGKNAGEFGSRLAKATRLAQSTIGGGTPPPNTLDGVQSPDPVTDIAGIRRNTFLGV